MVRFQLISTCSYAKNKLQMCSVTNISVDLAKCGETFHKFTQYTHCLSVTKNDLSFTEQSIHGNVSTHKYVLLC